MDEEKLTEEEKEEYDEEAADRKDAEEERERKGQMKKEAEEYIEKGIDSSDEFKELEGVFEEVDKQIKIWNRQIGSEWVLGKMIEDGEKASNELMEMIKSKPSIIHLQRLMASTRILRENTNKNMQQLLRIKNSLDLYMKYTEKRLDASLSDMDQEDRFFFKARYNRLLRHYLGFNFTILNLESKVTETAHRLELVEAGIQHDTSVTLNRMLKIVAGLSAAVLAMELFIIFLNLGI